MMPVKDSPLPQSCQELGALEKWGGSWREQKQSKKRCSGTQQQLFHPARVGTAKETLDVNNPKALSWEVPLFWTCCEAPAQAPNPVTSCKLEMKPEERLESPKRFSMVVRLLLKLAL